MMLCTPEGSSTANSPLSDRMLELPEPRCPNCSSPDTKPLSYNINLFPFAVYACRACAHVWRLPSDTAKTAINLVGA